MAIEVQGRPCAAAAPHADDVDSRVTGRVLGQAVRGVVFDVESTLLQAVADEARALFVCLTRRIDCGDADQIGGEPDDFVRGIVDRGQHAIDVRRVRHAAIIE